MSGAEALAILGLISSIITIIDTGHEIYKAANSLGAEEFVMTYQNIPLIERILQSLQHSVKWNHPPPTTDDLQAIKPALQICKDNLDTITTILRKVIQGPKDTWIDRYKKAVSSIVSRKKQKVESLMQDILVKLQLLDQLNSLHVDNTITGKLQTAIEQLSVIRSSLSDVEHSTPYVDEGVELLKPSSGPTANIEISGSDSANRNFGNNQSGGQSFGDVQGSSFAYKSYHYHHLASPASEELSILPHYQLPSDPNKSFTGRTIELNELKKVLFTEKEHDTVALFGLGGIGKTQVALQLAQWTHENAYQLQEDKSIKYSVFWVSAASIQDFEDSCTRIAESLTGQRKSQEPNPKTILYRYLSSDASGPWLLIVDNADDKEVLFGSSEAPRGICGYVPHSTNGLVVYTTRSKEMAMDLIRPAGHLTEITMMSDVEACSMFEKVIHRKQLLNDTLALTELMKELSYHETGYLPLAITQAAAYLDRNEITISKYMKLLRDTPDGLLDVLSTEFEDGSHTGSGKSVATTFLLSFNQIRKTDPIASDLLIFLSCMEPRAIPRTMLPDLGSEAVMVNAIGTLQAYRFISLRADSSQDMYDMHRLVHLGTKVWIERDIQIEGAVEDALQWLCKIFAKLDNDKCSVDPSRWAAYLPHAIQLLSAYESTRHQDDHTPELSIGPRKRLSDLIRKELRKRFTPGATETQEARNSSRPELTSRISRYLIQSGRHKEALHILQICHKWCTSHLPAGDIWGIAILDWLGRAYLEGGDQQKSIEFFEKAFKDDKKGTRKKEDHLESQLALATAYSMDAQTMKAIRVLKQAVINSKHLNDDHPQRLESRKELARAYLGIGQKRKAIPLFEDLIHRLAGDHPLRLLLEYELAKAYLDESHMISAFRLIKHLVMSVLDNGEDYPSCVPSRYNRVKAFLKGMKVLQTGQTASASIVLASVRLYLPGSLSSKSALEQVLYWLSQRKALIEAKRYRE
ncbi:hypothetical protein K461DRAFT_324829 [Myriangium duriaei CBS 260.36]|uniref:NB-ARC domain-containing protein n=1 Tax=Myriangium duriaei CBS 260.36 TaxID=1168546 RepID=A0A9P4MC98_9PEZI|nr:hypothetical protein K461DRAFT_324829 [Myriangium duriaei CBS 260.36]